MKLIEFIVKYEDLLENEGLKETLKVTDEELTKIFIGISIIEKYKTDIYEKQIKKYKERNKK